MAGGVAGAQWLVESGRERIGHWRADCREREGVCSVFSVRLAMCRDDVRDARGTVLGARWSVSGDWGRRKSTP